MGDKTWCFTLNNYVEDDVKLFESIECNYISCGREVGEKGTPHLQGCITFATSKRLKALKKISPRANWSELYKDDKTGRPLDLEGARNYCMKGDFFVNDNRKKKGERTDLEDIYRMVDDGATTTEIAREHPGSFIRYYKGIERLQQLIQNEHENAEYSLIECCNFTGLNPLEFDATCHVVQGLPGCGKTQYALSHFNKPLLVSHIDTLLEYDKKYHDGIVFDDMDFKHWHRTHQIHITDWDNSRQIHCRYRTAKIPKHTMKIFVCNEYPFSDDDAVRRRVTVTKVSER